MTRQHIRRVKGQQIMRASITSWMVIGSFMRAMGCIIAHFRVATATSASCSRVVPYLCMCRVTGMEKVVVGPKVPKGSSNWPLWVALSSAKPGSPTRERPLSPWLMTAVLITPAERASMACSTCMMKEQPPTIVLSTYRGTMPRYSTRSLTEVSVEPPATNSPSTSDKERPASSKALRMASEWRVRTDLSGSLPISSDSEAPTMAILPRRSSRAMFSLLVG